MEEASSEESEEEGVCSSQPLLDGAIADPVYVYRRSFTLKAPLNFSKLEEILQNFLCPGWILPTDRRFQ
jgi:hypothetical protein